MAINTSEARAVARLHEQASAKCERLRRQLEEAEQELAALTLTLKLLGQPTSGIANLDLHNMTQLEALIAIAKANTGLLVVKSARRLMTKAGLFKNPDNASSIIFTTIARSKKFEKAGKGKYKLLPEQAKLEPFPLPIPVVAG